MKKLLLLLIAVMAISTVSTAQVESQSVDAKVKSSLSALESAKASSVHEKRSLKASTWVSLGSKYSDVATASSFKIFPGMSEIELVLSMGAPGLDGEYDTVLINGVDYKRYSYPYINVYLAADVLSFWEDTEEVYPNALEEAYKAYEKALEIDPAYEKKMTEGYIQLASSLISRANSKYTLNDFAGAAKFFGIASKIGSKPSIAMADANMYKYFAGVSYVQSDDFANSLGYFQELEADNYLQDGDVYYYLAYSSQQLGNNEEAEKYYLKGLESFPSNQKVINQLINYYLTVKKDHVKVISLIKTAQDADPDNHIIVFIEGVAYQNMGNYAEAHAAYQRVNEMAPDYFDAYYNNALVHVAESDEKVNEMSAIDYSNRELYREVEAKYILDLKAAIEVLEKAIALKPENRDVMDLIKSVAFRLRDDENTKYKALYEKYDALLKAE